MRKFTNGRGEGADDEYAGSHLTSWTYRDTTVKAGGCPKGCGARRVDQQLGLEPTPDLYVQRIVEVFREVRRVLRDDGTCWVNLGDSYTSGGRDRFPTAEEIVGSKQATQKSWLSPHGRAPQPPGLKPKDLVGIPWRVAFALQTDGWYLRSDIIWSKPNPMPESVTDRPTKSHEYVFLLSKSAKYFFDQDAIREPAAWERWGDQTVPKHGGTNTGAGWIKGKSYEELKRERSGYRHSDMESYGLTHGTSNPSVTHPNGKNVRSVWEIATQPYPEAHFATYPEELVRRCVLAGTSERGCCPVCGKPWEREVERGESDYARLKREEGHERTDMDAAGFARGVILKEGEGGQTRRANGTVPSLRPAERTHVGWRPTCSCRAAHVPEMLDADVEQKSLRGEVPDLRSHLAPAPVPCIVLDPFLGSGTTAYVARKHGRRSIGIELNSDYCELAARRMQQQSLFALEAT